MGEEAAEGRDAGGGRGLLARATPAAPASVHLILAAAMWTVVGASMTGFGVVWVWVGTALDLRWAMAVAVVVGAFKSRLALDGAATRIAARIEARGDGRCIGGVLSARSWLLVAVMVVAGSCLRNGYLARPLVGLLYIAVGTALFLSSRIVWGTWRVSRSEPGSGTGLGNDEAAP